MEGRKNRGEMDELGEERIEGSMEEARCQKKN
jgi:hypothetical protein